MYNICPQQPWSIGEINAQIEICREFGGGNSGGCKGHIHFSQKYLLPENKYHTSCTSLGRTTVDFDDHASFSELFSPFLGLKQGPYNFHRALSLPGFAKFEEGIEPSAELVFYESNKIVINPTRTPNAIAIFSDFNKLMQVATVSENSEFKTVCLDDGSGITCDLTYLVPWIPSSEAAKISWRIGLIYKSEVNYADWAVTNLVDVEMV